MKLSLPKPLVLHPFLLGVYFILDGFASVANYVPLYEIILPLVLIILFSFCFILLIRLIVKDKIKSGVIASIILLPLLFYTKIVDAAGISFQGIGRQRHIILSLLLVIIVSIWLVIRSRKKLEHRNAYLNLLAICYVIYGVFLVASNLKPYDNSLELSLLRRETVLPAGPAVKIDKLPDIYYIILDTYAGSSVLKKYFNYDNNGFTGKLRKYGFYVAEESRSFSGSTLTSLASLLNLCNAPELSAIPEEIIVRLIKDNRAVDFLNSQSYEVINLSFFDLGNSPKFYRAFTVGEENRRNFHGLFLRSAFFGIASNIEANRLYKVNLAIFFRLKEIARAKRTRPRFVFAHIMMPHVPYCFDRNGNIISWIKRKPEFDRNAYLEQLMYTNKKVLEITDTLLGGQGVEPIIIIQGDHGFRRLKDSSEEPLSRSILNAYYLPAGCKNMLYPSITPANTFPVIFNCSFGASYELLKDS